jgi:hypothetical protein
MGLLGLTLAGDQVGAITRFDNSCSPASDCPASCPDDRYDVSPPSLPP